MKYLLDTHVLVWWVVDQARLPEKYRKILADNELQESKVGLSVISLWEISKLVQYGKLHFSFSLDQWFEDLESHPSLQLLPLNPRIILESSRLGPSFHKDPSDQIITATARVHGLQMLTLDEKIISSGIVGIA